MINKLIKYIGEYKKEAIIAPILTMIEAIVSILLPLVISEIVDNGISKNNLTYVYLMATVMCGLAIVGLTLGLLGGKVSATASTGFAKNLRKGLFYKINDFSFSNIDKFSVASLTNRITKDVGNIQNSFQMLIRICVRAPIMFICATIMSIILNPQLSIIFLLAIPILAIGLSIIISKAHPNFKKMFEKYDEMNAKVKENVTGIRVVKTFVKENDEIEDFKKRNTDVTNNQRLAEKIIILNNPLMQLVMYACTIAIAWFGGKMIVGGSMQTGMLISYFLYSTQILMSLMMISMVFIMVTMSRESGIRICEVLDEQIDILDTDADENLKVTNGNIDFNEVSFGYKKDANNLVLSNINLHIKSGETIGIIGGTGSAKSSLTQLIPRLYDAQFGEIKVSDNNVKNYKLNELRNNVAFVLQKNTLFSGTIIENLKWGNENATEEEIINACKKAQAHDFIKSFPDGYNTMLGQGGVNVSGGQKQRLCIARALLKNPKIMILDDSTSAVDTATDKKIQLAFKKDLSDITVIIIAQRINSIMNSDRIIVMNNGNIDAIGTHEQLLKTNQIYKDVYTSQSQGVE